MIKRMDIAPSCKYRSSFLNTTGHGSFSVILHSQSTDENSCIYAGTIVKETCFVTLSPGCNQNALPIHSTKQQIWPRQRSHSVHLAKMVTAKDLFNNDSRLMTTKDVMAHFIDKHFVDRH
jgi:hypothetical protein